MTKFIDQTKKLEDKKVAKKTVFKSIITETGLINDTLSEPSNFDNVILLRRKDNSYQFDLFVAFDDGNEGKSEFLYLGEAGDEFQ